MWVPLFYERGSDGLPRNWIAKMKQAIATLAPYFNTHRMVQEYTTELYAPALRRYEHMRENDAQPAKDLAAWQTKVRQGWSSVRGAQCPGAGSLWKCGG